MKKSFQTIFAFLLAGCGMVGAGILFDIAQEWSFFIRVPQAVMLLPALLGLKGNVEMTLASRLSTQARHKLGGNSGIPLLHCCHTCSSKYASAYHNWQLSGNTLN
uniref:SLC41A/MgtE integral membrane domain-containing protein n=1 Tax=Parascaris univalens TaxID=6257 RepID=A0A915CK96_PARUN